MNSAEDKSLRDLLGQWKIAEPLPPRFKERVWRRIEQTAGTTTGTTTVWELWQQWLESVFARKAVALTYVTILLLAGLTAGYVNGHAHQQRWKAQLAVRYVRALDPYQRNRD
jgi:hypothetical protein